MKRVGDQGLLARVEAPFPGEFAGASLKPTLQGAPRGGPAPFPGEFAGASLKRPLPRVRVLLDLSPSPANSPGPH